MNEKAFNEFIEGLFAKKIRKKGYDSTYYDVEVIDKEGRILIEQAIRSFMFDNRDNNLGVLEAKVFMYEQIISKSNFAPMIEKEKVKEKTD